jgi:MoxR-like ATPase
MKSRRIPIMTTSPSSALPKLKRQHTKCLDKVIIGWDDIEAVLVGCMSVNLNIILLGKHGLGKTHTGKLISEAFEEGSFRYYDCSKADMIALAGIPDPEALKDGRFDFAKHEQTIWEATVVLADEINRAPKSMQNLWLEVANDNALCGKPLRMKCLIATMNPENYTGTVKLDDALADRFACVVEIPVPGNSERIGAEVIEVLSANLSSSVEDDRAAAVARIKQVMGDIRELYKFLICDDRVFTTISRYVSTVLSVVSSNENKKRSETDVYISRRRYKLIAQSILAVASYYKIYGKSDWMVRGALDVLKYAIAENPTVQVPWDRVKQAHTKAQKALQSSIQAQIRRWIFFEGMPMQFYIGHRLNNRKYSLSF